VRVLLADDSPHLTLLFRAVLEDAGFEVVTASSGVAAIAAAQAHELDAAVLDVLMPGVSGDAVAERLRLDYPLLPVLLMTGDYGEQFVAGVPVPVLRKPFAPEALVRAVRELVEDGTVVER
jgi:two-component system OmpR family response regulator